jgi:hypothetical protein
MPTGSRSLQLHSQVREAAASRPSAPHRRPPTAVPVAEPARRRAPLLVSRSASGTSGGPHDPKTPWHFGAQTNERLLQWDNSAQAQLSRIWLWCGAARPRTGVVRAPQAAALAAHTVGGPTAKRPAPPPLPRRAQRPAGHRPGATGRAAGGAGQPAARRGPKAPRAEGAAGARAAGGLTRLTAL